MNQWMSHAVAAGCLLIPAFAFLPGRAEEPRGLAAKIEAAARIQRSTFEDTKKARNEYLDGVFREFAGQQGDTVSPEMLQQFHRLLKKQGLTSFEDFMAVEMSPLRFLTDSATGDQVPVFGPLGSDVINSWLGEKELLPGKPLEDQPIYRLAANALREHIDFTLIGRRDPTLSLSSLPSKLRENAQAAYARLNPTHRFDGGFDHPLYYATVREAAKKLFREDYPRLKLSMADIVKPEEAGGFGIRSCLLCHDQDHTGIYQRLLGQGMYLEAKARDLRASPDESAAAQKAAESFLRAADTVRTMFPEQVNTQAACEALAAMSRDNLARLRPGFPDFCATLKKLRCLNCHSSDARPPDNKRPADFGAFVLNLNGYYQTANIKALIKQVNLGDVEKSRLIQKATAKITHEGAEEARLDAAETEELRRAIKNWVAPFQNQAGAPR